MDIGGRHILFCLVAMANFLASTESAGCHSAPLHGISFPARFPGARTEMVASLDETAIASAKRKLEAKMTIAKENLAPKKSKTKTPFFCCAKQMAETIILLQRNLAIEKSYRVVAEAAAREANERAEIAEASLIELIKGLKEAISDTRAALSREEELKKKLAELEDPFPEKEDAVVEAAKEDIFVKKIGKVIENMSFPFF